MQQNDRTLADGHPTAATSQALKILMKNSKARSTAQCKIVLALVKVKKKTGGSCSNCRRSNGTWP